MNKKIETNDKVKEFLELFEKEIYPSMQELSKDNSEIFSKILEKKRREIEERIRILNLRGVKDEK